jgi:hypothetical protein
MVKEDSTEFEHIKMIKPTIDEMYAIILKDNNEHHVYIVKEVSEKSNVVIMKNISKEDDFIFELDNEELVLDSEILKYTIVDIERVIPFNLDILKKDIEQLQKLLTSDIVKDLDISLEEIKEKDMVYTIVELRETLKSELIYLYNAYDKYSLIKGINQMVDEYIILIKDKTIYPEYLYNIYKNKSLPKWLIPIVDNPLKLYINTALDDKAYNELNELYVNVLTNGSYHQRIQSLLDLNRPVEPSISDIGLNTNIHQSHYLRDCVQTETCMGIKGPYKYDRRNNKLPLQVYNDGIPKMYHRSDTLNIVGLLYIPDDHLIHGYDIDDHFTMKEKNILNSIVTASSRKLIYLKHLPIINKSLDSLDELEDLNSIIKYSLNTRLNPDEFYSLLKKITPSIELLLSNVDSKITSKLVNYGDFRTLFTKYNIDPHKLSLDNKNIVHKLLKTNVNKYTSTNSKLSKIIINIVNTELTIFQKIQQSKSLIMNMVNIPKRNEYLQKFIKIFTREPRSIENKLSLYNIFTNEILLCKHYLYSSIYHKNVDAHTSLISIYGKAPEDGVIYCKNCGEYLCDEGFSEFDGFAGEQPILMRAVMEDTTDILKGFKETTVDLVKLISTNVGVSINDTDIKLILDIHSTFNEDILANIRYGSMNITDTDEHPEVKDINKQYAKDSNKKTKSKNIKEFQSYLKNTNKVISLVSIIILIIQSSIPIYNFKNNYEFNFFNIEKDEIISYNKKVIDYCLHKIHKNINIYKNDTIWTHYNKLINEYKIYDLVPTKDQIINVVNYLISPLYPDLLSRINDYKTFIKSTNQEYIRNEWPIFKPLRNNNLIKKIDEYLLSIKPENKAHFILNYNTYPVENISKIHSIHESKDELIHSLIKIPISDIMINKAFILLFKLSVSNHGINKHPVSSIDLHINRLIETINDEHIQNIFTKHKWSSSNISYKKLRTNIIPDIINHYQKTSQQLETCYDNESICNKFIHININNYELSLLKSASKRVYQYIESIVYTNKKFDELNDDFKNKIFNSYCKDPSGNIIKKQLNDSYLGKYLISIEEDDIQLPDTIRELEIPIDTNAANFKDILDTIQLNILPLGLYMKPKIYNMDDYNIDIYRNHTDIERNILNVFLLNNNFDLGDDNPIIDLLRNYINTINKPSPSLNKDFEVTFSTLTTDEFIDNISKFLSQSKHKNHMKRFENIFINTSDSINISNEDRGFLEGENFRYKNLRQSDITKILNLFSNDSKLTIDIITGYIYRIKYILASFKGSCNTSSYIPKTWKLTESSRSTYTNYIKDNAFVLHNDLFKLNPLYKGFHEYGDKNEYSYIFNSLLEYISPYTNSLYKLRTDDFSYINPMVHFVMIKYVMLFIFNKLIEFHTKLIEDDESILTMLETNLRKYSDIDELQVDFISDAVETIIIDIISEILQIHYDSKWVISNINKDNLSKRLSKSKEKEKQQLIQNLDTMSDEQRSSTVELQKMGIKNWFKTSGKENESRIIEEYTNAPDSEKYEMFNSVFKNDDIVDQSINISTGEIDNSSEYQPLLVVEEDTGYYNQDDIDEDGQMGDELHEYYDEDILDNNFNTD